jgi:hypothetical protein
MEWRLEGEEPKGRDRPWMELAHQPGFPQRAAMVTGLARLVIEMRRIGTVTDLGCGDGEMLAMLPPSVAAWGYEIGLGDAAAGWARGLDVRQADILTDPLAYGKLLIAAEVLEHLDDPVAFLKGLPDRILIASSPSAETGEWHNPIHSWAWDVDGYRGLLERSGWRVLYQAECDGGLNTFAGVTGPQRFQAAVAVKP